MGPCLNVAKGRSPRHKGHLKARRGLKVPGCKDGAHEMVWAEGVHVQLLDPMERMVLELLKANV